ncbi:MAG TPA: hypothetical protein VM682_07990 [Bacillus sp. (in: firmicutes)]|nr:hypothetical protein [Bacillus sp. (in: firmicutes)]
MGKTTINDLSTGDAVEIEQNEFIAKKDFVICQNEHFHEIKAGDDLSKIPEKFHANLKTEGVL